MTSLLLRAGGFHQNHRLYRVQELQAAISLPVLSMRMLVFRRWLESLESSRLTDNTAIEGLKSAGQTARPPYIQGWEGGAGVLVKAYLLPGYKAIRHHFLDNLIFF